MGLAAQIRSPFHTQGGAIDAACGTSPLEFTTLFQLFHNTVFTYTALHPHAQSRGEERKGKREEKKEKSKKRREKREETMTSGPWICLINELPPLSFCH